MLFHLKFSEGYQKFKNPQEDLFQDNNLVQKDANELKSGDDIFQPLLFIKMAFSVFLWSIFFVLRIAKNTLKIVEKSSSTRNTLRRGKYICCKDYSQMNQDTFQSFQFYSVKFLLNVSCLLTSSYIKRKSRKDTAWWL